MLKIFPKSLDEPIPTINSKLDSFSSESGDLQSISAGRDDVRKEIRKNEASAIMESIMNLLTPRERMAVEALRIGKNYPEIGETMGITKQAAHKSVRSGLDKLRAGLQRLGYEGVASDGLLASSFNNKKSNHG
jgi:DNA-directed RNA polymerase specialized sigma24 family protein